MSLAIVIPTYNEAKNIERLLQEVLEYSNGTIIVVDDASPDQTARIVEEFGSDRVRLIQRSGKYGLGSAYREGFDYALKHGFTSIIQMDADFSHNPKSLSLLLAEQNSNQLIMGSRYIEGGSIEGWNPWRHFCSRSAILASRLYLGIPSKDITSGFRLWSADLLAQVLGEQIASSGYAFQEEMLFHAHRLGGQVKELPITFVDRKLGHSKLGRKDIIEFFSTLKRLRSRYGKI